MNDIALSISYVTYNFIISIHINTDYPSRETPSEVYS